MALTSMPYLTIQESDANGVPYAGAKMFFYKAGTSTKLDTYSDATGATPNTNPVILDAAGRATVFFQAATYDVVLAPSTDSDPPVSPYWTRSGIASVPVSSPNVDIPGTAGETLAADDVVYLSDGTGGTTAGRWYLANAANAYSSSTAKIAGVATTAIASAASGFIRLSGRVTGLVGLTAGKTYYVSALTPGAITATSPSNSLEVGVADSTTSLVLSITSVTSSVASSVGGVNLIKDPTFLIWAAGDSAAPTHWAISGAGASIARETSTIKIGPISAALTAGAGATAYLLQNILPTATFNLAWLGSNYISIGSWVRCGTASKAALYITDGVNSSTSSFHSGAAAWEWLTLTHQLNAAATTLSCGMSLGVSTTAYLSGTTALLGSQAPTQYQPAPCAYGTIRFSYPGTVAIATQWDTWIPGRPALIKQVQLYAKTAPTGQALIVDVNTWDGSAFTTAFTTKPQIAAGANSGGATPDGTYARRCLSTYVATTAYPTSAGQFMDMDVDQVGSGTAGADLSISIRVLQYTSPLEAFLGPTEIQ